MDNVGPMAVGAPGRYMKSDFGHAQMVKIHKSSFIFWRMHQFISGAMLGTLDFFDVASSITRSRNF